MAFDAFALILGMLALGMLFARLRMLPDSAPEVLNLVVLHVCLPAAVLIYVPRLRLDASLLALVATPWLLMGATVALVLACTRWLHLRRDQHAVLLLCVGLGNTSFIGYPMVQALLGEQALPYAVVYDQLGSFLLLSSFGLYVVAAYGGDTPPSPRAFALRMLRFPPLWALVFAFVAMPEHPPAWIAAMLRRLSDALLPLVMLAVGLSIRLRMPHEELRPLLAGLALKLLLLPLLALGLGKAMGLHGDILHASVLEAGMPAMVTAGALAISHGLAPRLAAALVGYGILLSLLSLPGWAWLLRQLS
ncbi:MAG: AEC family transporter [Thermomonas sp.]|uniref:AEC family transporter n=1 Tax=Thermomonas sp. TaxID=1971895 RepID=UPI0039E4E6DC